MKNKIRSWIIICILLLAIVLVKDLDPWGDIPPWW